MDEQIINKIPRAVEMNQKEIIHDSHNIKITTDKILFFDMDETLVYTDYANFLSYKKAILSVTHSDHGLTYKADKRFNRKSLIAALPNSTEQELSNIIQLKEQYYYDFINETKLNVQIVKILLKYSKTNITVLVTNCHKERAMRTIKHHGLHDKFNSFFFNECIDSGNNKFQNAISKLNIAPTTVIAFENEESEILHAKMTGIQIINPRIYV